MNWKGSLSSISHRTFKNRHVLISWICTSKQMFPPCTLRFTLTSLHFFFYFKSSNLPLFFFFKTKSHKVLLWRLDDLIAGCVAGSFFHFDGVLSYSFEPAHPKHSLVSFSIKSAWNDLIQNSGRSVHAGRVADPSLWCFTWLPSLLSLFLSPQSVIYTVRILQHPLSLFTSC